MRIMENITVSIMASIMENITEITGLKNKISDRKGQEKYAEEQQ